MEDIFEFEEKEIVKQKVLIIDQSSLAHITIFSSLNKFKQMLEDTNETNLQQSDLYKIFKQMYLEKIFYVIQELRPTKVVFAIDSRPYWRYKFYKEYKGKRKDQRDASEINFEEFYPIMDTFIETLKNTFSNFYFIKVDECEADDVVAVLSTKTFKNDSVVIYSGDGDFNQLLQYPHIKRYNPMIKDGSKLVNCLNPSLELNQKVIIGDGGDNIPNILVLPEKYPHKNLARKIGVGPVMADKILENGVDSDFVVKKVLESYPTLSSVNSEDKTKILEGIKKLNVLLEDVEFITDEEKKLHEGDLLILKNQLESHFTDRDLVKKLVKENYQRNRILIDLSCIPSEYVDRILESWKSYINKGINPKGIYTLLYGNGFIKLYEDYVSKFKIHLEKIK